MGVMAAAVVAAEAFVIRTYQPADAEQVHALFAAGMRWYPEHGVGGPLHGFIESYIADAIADDLSANMEGVYLSKGSNFWCVIDQRTSSRTLGKIIGIVGAQALGTDPYGIGPGPVVELRRMSVHIGARGLGLASRLVQVLEDHARAHGF